MTRRMNTTRSARSKDGGSSISSGGTTPQSLGSLLARNHQRRRDPPSLRMPQSSNNSSRRLLRRGDSSNTMTSNHTNHTNHTSYTNNSSMQGSFRFGNSSDFHSSITSSRSIRTISTAGETSISCNTALMHTTIGEDSISLIDHESIAGSVSTFVTTEGAWAQQSVKFTANNFIAQKKVDDGCLEDHYDLGDFLGEGAYGEVYLAIHKESGEERAVKAIDKQKSKEENQNVIEEFDVVKDLDHPNILKLYALFESDTHYFLVTDLYAGGELYELLEEEGHFEEEETALLMNNILSCINYCHKKKLVHRDLKPENILLEHTRDFDDLKIIDFGLAAYGDVFNEVKGTSYYVAPQVLEGQYTSKCDVWSCGIICFLVLGGYAPFEGGNEREITEAVMHGAFDFNDPAWDTVSDGAKDFISYLLIYEEDERPTAEEALQHPWLKHIRTRKSWGSARRRESARMSFGALQQFNADSKFKQCVCSLISSQLLKKQEKEEIDMVFRALDFDCDGTLTRDDIEKSYKKCFGQDLDEDDIDEIFLHCNFSGTGAISYSEFAVAMLMEKNMIDEAKLMAAFKIFDKDDKGYITIDDLKEALSLDDDMEDYIIYKVIGQVDENGDGTIHYDEFKEMMINAPEDETGGHQQDSFSYKMGKSISMGCNMPDTSMGCSSGRSLDPQDLHNQSFHNVLQMFQKRENAHAVISTDDCRRTL